MAHQLMNEEKMKEWILRRLGAPLLKVELAACNLDDSIEESRRWFAAKKGFKKRTTINIIDNVVEYPLPDDVDTVTDFVVAASPFDIALVYFPFNLFEGQIPYNVFAAPSTLGLYSTFTQALQHIEVAKRVLSIEPEWRQEDRKLLVFPTRKTSSVALIEYKTNSYTLEQMNERDHDLLKRYALMIAKETLGRVRSKYGEYPTAQGTTSLDGDKLLEEAQRDKEALEEEIAQSGFPLGFLVG